MPYYYRDLKERLKSIGLGNSALSWFKNYLSDRTQCVAVDNYTSSMLRVRKGVPQGSLQAPLRFSIFINELGQGIKSDKIIFMLMIQLFIQRHPLCFKLLQLFRILFILFSLLY